MKVNKEFIWDDLLKKLSVHFGQELELEGILFLIGVQELGVGKKKYSKNEKLDVMHVAICTLLEPYGYYIYEGRDKDGWPHWQLNESLPFLKPGEQQILIKKAIVDYFDKNGL